MKAIEFKEQNLVLAKDQPQYNQLPVYYEQNSDQGEMIACFQLTWRERLTILFTGKLWSCLLSFHKPPSPQRISVSKWDMFNKENLKKVSK